MTAAAKLIVGIDLGTTHTVVASAPTRGPSAATEVFPLPQLVAAGEVAERPLLPSFLYAPPADEPIAAPWQRGGWILGEHARRRGQEVPGRLIGSAKSWLCHAAVDRTAAILPWGSDVPDDVPRLSPVEVSARLLGHVREAWDRAAPDAPLAKQEVVLTVPASFDQVARELTLRAAADAGLTVRLLEEPQAAFYDLMRRIGAEGLAALVAEDGTATVLVVDIGGGTTDLTLIRAQRTASGIELERVAVGRHLLLGGDNMDLALAHRCEALLGSGPLEPQAFAQLTLACHTAKERLLGDEPPGDVAVTIAGRGSALVGATRSVRLTREDVEQLVLDGFFPAAARTDKPRRARAGLVAFGLPYEQDAAITRHVASFFDRHAAGAAGPTAVLLNGGVFRSPRVRERLLAVVGGWSAGPVVELPVDHPDLAVARGAVAYGLALSGQGVTIGGGAPRGYYVGIAGERGQRQALCVVPRGAKEGERHVVRQHPLLLRVGQAVRFELFASDDALVDAPGAVVSLDPERFLELPPVTTSFEGAADEEVRVHLEGELSAIGTLDLACVAEATAERFRLAFDLRAEASEAAAKRPSRAPAPRLGGARIGEAHEAIERVFGKGRKDAKPREIKDLLRTLEKTLGERAEWTLEVNRALYDTIAPLHKARRRSADHERLFWMLAGFCLRPGIGHPEDPRRIELIAPLFQEGVAFPAEARVWQQFFIAWRRLAAGLDAELQLAIRERLDPFLAPAESKLKKPKGFKPLAPEELLELASWLERVPPPKRVELGRWLLERTWTSRDPRLWAALGRVGSRVPAYASVHHVVAPNVVERWLDHLLREKWDEVPTAARTAVQLARVTADRARDVSADLRAAVERALVKHGAPADLTRCVREQVPLVDNEMWLAFGEDLPVGLRLAPV